jgi:hypothetical protein
LHADVLRGVVIFGGRIVLTVVIVIIISSSSSQSEVLIDAPCTVCCGSAGSASRLLGHSRQHCSFQGLKEVEYFLAFQYQTISYLCVHVTQ